MQLTNGQTVYISFATTQGSDLKPFAFVTSGTVLDAENGIVRRQNGAITVFDAYYHTERLHETAADAWGAAAATLEADAHAIATKAAECRAKAAAAGRIVAVTA